jgi:hypothetical protein
MSSISENVPLDYEHPDTPIILLPECLAISQSGFDELRHGERRRKPSTPPGSGIISPKKPRVNSPNRQFDWDGNDESGDIQSER